MGAALAGVFCGVLVVCLLDLGTSIAAVGVECCGGRVSEEGVVGQKETYGAEMESIFLLRIGSDILAESVWFRDAKWQNGEGCCVLV